MPASSTLCIMGKLEWPLYLALRRALEKISDGNIHFWGLTDDLCGGFVCLISEGMEKAANDWFWFFANISLF